MLVLERKPINTVGDNQALAELVINENIRIIIKESSYKSVHIMIDAPDDVDVWRREIYDRIVEQRKSEQ